jgi:hypothetical protein
MSAAASLRLFVRKSHPTPLITPRFSRPITSVTFHSYKNSSHTQKVIISAVKKFAAVSGLDDAGADSISIRYAKEFSVIC